VGVAIDLLLLLTPSLQKQTLLRHARRNDNVLDFGGSFDIQSGAQEDQMKNLEQQMAFYAAYHRDARNKLSHFIGIPLIVFGVMLALSWPRLSAGSIELTPAMATTAWILIYYLLLDLPLGAAMIVVLGVLLYAADIVARMPMIIGVPVFLIAFVGGWIIQLIGHVYEGRKPALVDNLFQIFVAPLFLVAEVFFMLGLRRETQHKVEQLSHQHDGKVAAAVASSGAMQP
jgi:uncharacterized membrane protein YGL010W